MKTFPFLFQRMVVHAKGSPPAPPHPPHPDILIHMEGSSPSYTLVPEPQDNSQHLDLESVRFVQFRANVRDEVLLLQIVFLVHLVCYSIFNIQHRNEILKKKNKKNFGPKVQHFFKKLKIMHISEIISYAHLSQSKCH